MTAQGPTAGPGLRLGTRSGRWVIATAVLGSGVAFIDGTVVNAALPAISRDFHAGLADLQWVVTGYLLTLGALFEHLIQRVDGVAKVRNDLHLETASDPQPSESRSRQKPRRTARKESY